MAAFRDLLSKLQELRDSAESTEPTTDTQALLLVDLNNLLARADVILRAFTADESEEQ